jgi:hypothetical protein
MPETTHYVAGVCNIGRAEIQARKLFGWAMVAMTLVLAALLVSVPLDPVWRLLVVVPATMAAVGLWQAYAGFCAAFGLRGLYNFGPNVGQARRAPADEDRRRDRRRAGTILVASTAIGAIVALATYAFPT